MKNKFVSKSISPSDVNNENITLCEAGSKSQEVSFGENAFNGVAKIMLASCRKEHKAV